jgi:hypothetical protein
MRSLTSALMLLPALLAPPAAQNGAQDGSNVDCPLLITGGSVVLSESPSRIWDKIIRKDLLRLELRNTTAVPITSFWVAVSVTYYGVTPLKLVSAETEPQFYSYDGSIDPQRRVTAEWKLLMPAAGIAKATLRKVVFANRAEWSAASENECSFPQGIATPLRQSA